MRQPPQSLASFSLVEVVLALGIVSFALVAIVGLLSVGLKTNKESSEQIDAVGLASLLINTRRARPTDNISRFALPPLNVAYTPAIISVTIGSDGTTTTNRTSPSYQLAYQIGTNALTGNRLSLVRLILWQPANTPMPTNSPGRYYELNTQVALP